VLGVLMTLSFFVLLTATVREAVVALSWVITSPGLGYAEYVTSAAAFERPSGMVAANLGLATLVPISIVAVLLVHQRSPRWLISVEGRVRWRYLLVCLGVAAVALNGVTLVSIVGGPPISFSVQPDFWMFLGVIMLTSPLQAFAEEYFFRGYLLQALGSLVASPWFGVVVSSLVFALLHGTQNLPLFLDRLAFGLLAAMLVLRTGGLEAGIAAHVVNNISAYLFAALTSSIASLKALQSIGWVDAAFDISAFALFALVAWWVGRRMRLRRVTEVCAVAAVEGRR
jgi:membrane protease YdiL (CAAX protease family)